MDTSPSMAGEHFDVVIVGAGLSGIGAACHLEAESPERTYTILEARDAIGGTWDLFRYPGIRSDSDMFTLGYDFRPWEEGKAIADGPSIRRYVRETARDHGVEHHIRFHHRVVRADWSSQDARWHIEAERTDTGETVHLTCSFLYGCTGYYRYDEGSLPHFEGLERFSGPIVHPQHWPEDFTYDGQRVVVIGSGATAVTLVPAMAERAAHVTMLQRSPTWIGAVPGRDKLADTLRDRLPAKVAHRLIRSKNILFTLGFYNFCQRFPDRARSMLLGLTARQLGDDEDLVKEHFTPTYDPWDQRFCAVPDADLFRCLRRGDAEVVTDHVDRFVPEGVRLRSGRVLEAEVVVTATGLTLKPFGGIAPSVDGRTVDLHDQFVWQGAMLTGIPNFAVCIGYTNA